MAAATTIDVWVIHLNAIAADCGAFLDRFLSVREQERAQRYVFARDATRFRVCRAVLRIVLAWYVQDAPERILLETGPCGKPFLGQTSAVHFNVSHSAGLGAIACTTVGEVGIDIELVRQDLASREIALTNFTKKEAALVAAEATRTQALKFFRLWTRKEAVLKAVGCGITQGLDSVDVSQEPPTVVSLNGKAGHGRTALAGARPAADGELCGGCGSPSGMLVGLPTGIADWRRGPQPRRSWAWAHEVVTGRAPSLASRHPEVMVTAALTGVLLIGLIWAVSYSWFGRF